MWLRIGHPKLPNGKGSPTNPAFLRLSGIFSRFSQGLQKMQPKVMYPHLLPDTSNFLPLTKKSQFFDNG
jgi:hypothetical protein